MWSFRTLRAYRRRYRRLLFVIKRGSEMYVYIICFVWAMANIYPEGFEKHFRHITNFVGANSRKSDRTGASRFYAMFLLRNTLYVSQKTAAGRRSRHTDYTTRCYGQLRFRCVVRLHKARRRRSACGDSRNEREYALCRRETTLSTFRK